MESMFGGLYLSALLRTWRFLRLSLPLTKLNNEQYNLFCPVWHVLIVKLLVLHIPVDVAVAIMGFALEMSSEDFVFLCQCSLSLYFLRNIILTWMFLWLSSCFGWCWWWFLDHERCIRQVGHIVNKPWLTKLITSMPYPFVWAWEISPQMWFITSEKSFLLVSTEGSVFGPSNPVILYPSSAVLESRSKFTQQQDHKSMYGMSDSIENCFWTAVVFITATIW